MNCTAKSCGHSKAAHVVAWSATALGRCQMAHCNCTLYEGVVT